MVETLQIKFPRGLSKRPINNFDTIFISYKNIPLQHEQFFYQSSSSSWPTMDLTNDIVSHNKQVIPRGSDQFYNILLLSKTMLMFLHGIYLFGGNRSAVSCRNRNILYLCSIIQVSSEGRKFFSLTTFPFAQIFLHYPLSKVLIHC